VDLSGELGVRLQLELGLDEVVVCLCLLEGGLTVLPDHDERRQKDRLEGHDQGERRPRTLLEHEHPHAEGDRMDVDERHRPGECGDPVSDLQLDTSGALFQQRRRGRMDARD
jgi:hypothetical protein